MNNELINELTGVMIDLSVSLLGVSLTLLALIPTLIELMRLKSSDFVSRMESKNSLRNVMLTLSVTVILYSVSLGAGLISKFCPQPVLLWISLVSFTAGLLTTVYNSLYIGNAIRNSM